MHVLTNTYVTRVLPSEPNGTDFRTIEYAVDSQSTKRLLQARREVILSGGVIGTPHILLHSGIGPRGELAKVGIESIVDNASVGKNLTDQVSTLVTFGTTIQDTE